MNELAEHLERVAQLAISTPPQPPQGYSGGPPGQPQQYPPQQQQQEPDPMAQMWDPDWISSVTPVRDSEVSSGSAKAANPKHGSSKGPVASKPHAGSK